MTNRAINNAVVNGVYDRIEFLPGLPGGLPSIRFSGTDVGFYLDDDGRIAQTGAGGIAAGSEVFIDNGAGVEYHFKIVGGRLVTTDYAGNQLTNFTFDSGTGLSDYRFMPGPVAGYLGMNGTANSSECVVYAQNNSASNGSSAGMFTAFRTAGDGYAFYDFERYSTIGVFEAGWRVAQVQNDSDNLHFYRTGIAGLALTYKLTRAGELARGVDNDYLYLYGGNLGGANIALAGASASNPGQFYITATDGVHSKQLVGKPDGTLIWAGVTHFKRGDEAWIDLGTTNAPNIDFSTGGAFRFHPTGAFVVTFSNLPAANEAANVTLEVSNAAGHTGTYPGGFRWSGGAEPVWSANIDLVKIYASGDNATQFGVRSFAG